MGASRDILLQVNKFALCVYKCVWCALPSAAPCVMQINSLICSKLIKSFLCTARSFELFMLKAHAVFFLRTVSISLYIYTIYF